MAADSEASIRGVSHHLTVWITCGTRAALLTGAAVAIALASQLASAQTAATTPTSVTASEEAGPQLQEVVVTGSLIKRNDFETPSPVQVITADDMTKSGYTSVAQVLNTLSANGQGSLSQAFSGSFAGGASGVALRGLTVGSTLTLIDGERMVAYPLTDDGQRSFVDTSSIPMLAVERIDVLKDGASAEYGSDAIAGVVNVVLRKNYTGAEFSAEAGTTIHADGSTERLTGIAGIGDLVSDGYNGWLAVEWRHQDPIYIGSRSGAWSALNFTPYGGTNFAPGAGSLYTLTGNNPFPTGSGPYYVNSSAASFQDGTFTTAACPSAAAMAADQCTYPENREQIQPQSDNLNVLGRFTLALGDSWQEVVTASLFRSLSEQILGYSTTAPNGPGSSIQFPNYGPGFANVGGIANPLVMPDGTYPVATLFEFGQNTAEYATNTYRLFFDTTGKAAGWDIDAQAGIMYALTDVHYTGVINYAALQTALNNSYVLGSGGPQVAGVAPNIESDMSNSLQVLDVHATRSLFTLPGGPLAIGVGAQYNHRYLDATQSAEATNGLYDGINLAYAYGGQTDVGGFAELDAPIVKGLEADAAVRYDHYDNTGGTTVPKFGLKYTPIEQISLRGTFGKGFRAPNPAESGHAASAYLLGNFADPTLCPSQNGQPYGYGFNYGTTTPVAGDVAFYCDFPGVLVQTTNPNLRPEHSTNYTFGAIFQPIPQTSLSVDFWNIVLEDPIITNSEFPTLPLPPAASELVRSSSPSTFPLVGGGTISATYPIYATTTYVNAGKIHVDGIDIDFDAHFDLGRFGRLSPQLNWSHEIVWNIGSCYAGDCTILHLAGTHGPSGISGDTGNPKDKGVLTLAWDKGPLNVTATVNYVGPYTLTDPSTGTFTCALAIASSFNSAKYDNGYTPPQYCVVKEFVDVNLYARYSINKHFDVFASVQNLFNTPPPVDLQTYGGNLLAYNPSLEQDGAIGSLISAGFRWKF